MATTPDKKAGKKVSTAKKTMRSATRGRPRQHDDIVDRRDAILDAAEALFCVNGFDAVAVREVATMVGVDVALLNYYFESKRGMFDAVFRRRAEVVNQMRLQSMNRYRDSTVEMTVEGCLQAYFEPVLAQWETGGAGWKNYLRLVALINITPSWGGEVMTQHFDPVVQRLIDLLREVLPEAREEDLFWSYHFISGAFALSFADTGRIDTLSGGLCKSGNIAAIRKRMAYFMASGTTNLCRSLAKARP